MKVFPRSLQVSLYLHKPNKYIKYLFLCEEFNLFIL